MLYQINTMQEIIKVKALGNCQSLVRIEKEDSD